MSQILLDMDKLMMVLWKELLDKARLGKLNKVLQSIVFQKNYFIESKFLIETKFSFL